MDCNIDLGIRIDRWWRDVGSETYSIWISVLVGLFIKLDIGYWQLCYLIGQPSKSPLYCDLSDMA